MERREFMKAASVAGLSTALSASLSSSAPAAEGAATEPAPPKPTTPTVTVWRLDTDRFVLEFAPREPRPMRVLQLTDTHFGDTDLESKVQDKRTFLSIQRLVDRHRPDFLVHTGDFINNDQGPKISFEAIEVFDSLGVPWTHALGNHDIGARSVAEFRKPMKQAAVGEFLTPEGPQYAFRFDIVSAGQTAPGFGLFCFDSGFKEPNRKVAQPQLKWFRDQMARDAQQGNQAPSLAMIHIPVIEFEKLRAAGAHQGNFGESVCYDSDTGDTFQSLHASQRVRAVFSGHDHKNDYAGNWNGVELVYGRVGGWNAYGELPRGGRLIEIDLAKQSYSHRLVFPDA
jgi:hypothetical protein